MRLWGLFQPVLSLLRLVHSVQPAVVIGTVTGLVLWITLSRKHWYSVVCCVVLAEMLLLLEETCAVRLHNNIRAFATSVDF